MIDEMRVALLDDLDASVIVAISGAGKSAELFNVALYLLYDYILHLEKINKIERRHQEIT
jgi:SHS2 domain-containing protein